MKLVVHYTSRRRYSKIDIFDGIRCHTTEKQSNKESQCCLLALFVLLFNCTLFSYTCDASLSRYNAISGEAIGFIV
jgi:hypothetical protein